MTTSKAIGNGISVILLALVAVAVIGAGHVGNLWVAVGLGIFFTAVYLAGVLSPLRPHQGWAHYPSDDRRSGWAYVWLGTLTVIWIGLLLVSPTAMWVAFPLILLQVGVLGLGWGAAAALVTAGAASTVTLMRLPSGEPASGVLFGPLLGSVLAVAIMWGARTISRESQALEGLQAT